MHINYKLIIIHIFAWICWIVGPLFIDINKTSELFLIMCLLICASVIIYTLAALMYNVLHCGSESNSIITIVNWFFNETVNANSMYVCMYIVGMCWLLPIVLINISNIIFIVSIIPFLTMWLNWYNIWLLLGFMGCVMFFLFAMSLCVIFVVYSMFKFYKNNST